MFRNADGVTSRSSSQVPRASFAQITFGFFLAALLGDTIKKGQLLLHVQSADVATAFSDYQKAVADEQLTRTQLERAVISMRSRKKPYDELCGLLREFRSLKRPSGHLFASIRNTTGSFEGPHHESI